MDYAVILVLVGSMVKACGGGLNGPLMECNDSWMKKQAKRQKKIKQKLIDDIK